MPHEYLPGSMAERLQDLLKEKKMTQAQLADALGLSESTINRYINGQTEKISTETIIAMAKLFNVSTDFLLGLTNIPYKTNFDIERLGLTEKAGMKLLSGEINMDALNYLLTQPDFAVLTTQMAQMKSGTYAAGFASMNQIIQDTTRLMQTYVRKHPGDKRAANQTIRDIRALRQPEYEADTAALEETFRRILADLKKGSRAQISEAKMLTSAVMETAAAKIQGSINQPQKLRSVNADMIIEPIIDAVAQTGMSEADKETFRAGLRVLFKKREGNDPSGK